jgi:hypothetical protein
MVHGEPRLFMRSNRTNASALRCARSAPAGLQPGLAANAFDLDRVRTTEAYAVEEHTHAVEIDAAPVAEGLELPVLKAAAVVLQKPRNRSRPSSPRVVSPLAESMTHQVDPITLRVVGCLSGGKGRPRKPVSLLRASVGSTEAAKDVVARFGVVGPKHATRQSIRIKRLHLRQRWWRAVC